MNGTEFRCKREYLGLSAAWLAKQLSVDTRTVQRWETMAEIPTRAAEAIAYLYAGAARAVSMIAIEQLKAKERQGAMPPLAVPHGGNELPASWHRMIAARVAERTGQQITAAA